MMNELLKRIFTDVISREDDSFATDKYIDSRVQEIVDNYSKKVSDEELEELRGLLYQVALIAEQEGFVLGMRYLLKMIISLLSDL